MKKLVMILFCICTGLLLTGCATTKLWKKGTVHFISDRQITQSGKDVHFQANETIIYQFAPFQWTSRKKHDNIFNAKSGAISEWTLEKDINATRFFAKYGLPMYRLPKESVLLRPGERLSKGSSPQTHLKVHPDDFDLFQKAFLFQGRSKEGPWIVTLQIPIKIQGNKLICCMPEDSEIVTQADYLYETKTGLPLVWQIIWTPCAAAFDLFIYAAYLYVSFLAA